MERSTDFIRFKWSEIGRVKKPAKRDREKKALV
jgi:hypothetical protein